MASAVNGGDRPQSERERLFRAEAKPLEQTGRVVHELVMGLNVTAWASVIDDIKNDLAPLNCCSRHPKKRE